MFQDCHGLLLLPNIIIGVAKAIVVVEAAAVVVVVMVVVVVAVVVVIVVVEAAAVVVVVVVEVIVVVEAAAVVVVVMVVVVVVVTSSSSDDRRRIGRRISNTGKSTKGRFAHNISISCAVSTIAANTMCTVISCNDSCNGFDGKRRKMKHNTAV